MKLQRALDWVHYHGTSKPTESISDARWKAMVQHIYLYYLTK